MGLLATGSIMRGVFCEWSVVKVTENPRLRRETAFFAGAFFYYNCMFVYKFPYNIKENSRNVEKSIENKR